MRFGGRIRTFALAQALRFGSPFFVRLRRGQVVGDCVQHLTGMVAQLDVIHGQGGRLDGPCKVFPRLQDLFHITANEFA